jgi:hypothetical protein
MTVSDTSDLEQRLARQAEKAKQAEDASIGEVVDYVKAYAKQETLGPAQGCRQLAGLRLRGRPHTRARPGPAAGRACCVCCRPSGNDRPRAICRGSRTLIVLVVAGVLLALTLMRIKKSTLHKEPK